MLNKILSKIGWYIAPLAPIPHMGGKLDDYEPLTQQEREHLSSNKRIAFADRRQK